MSLLLLVRHGQTDFADGDYDKLSAEGRAQAAALGRAWAHGGVTLDHVFIGPRRRHKQTFEVAKDAYVATGGARFPDAEVLDGLDEFPAAQLLRVEFGDRLPSDEEGETFPLDLLPPGKEALVAFDRLMQRVGTRWQAGELTGPGIETFEQFRHRIRDALARIVHVGRGKAVAAFTSAGPVAAAVGHALGLKDAVTLELTWLVRNTAVSELLFTESRFSLRSFNELGPRA